MLEFLLNRGLGGDEPHHPLYAHQVVFRCGLIYIAGLLFVRLGKSRLLSKATPLDMILAFILGSVLSRGINGTASLSSTLVATISLIALHWAFTRLAYWSKWWEWLIKGETRMLVSNGQIHWANMRHSHISEEDLLEQLRLQANCDDLARIKSAVKERNGDVGVIKHPPSDVHVDVTVQDGVQTVHVIVGRE